jgi:hypothetical protein
MHISLRRISLFLCADTIILYGLVPVLLAAFGTGTLVKHIKPLPGLERTCYANREHGKVFTST